MFSNDPLAQARNCEAAGRIWEAIAILEQASQDGRIPADDACIEVAALKLRHPHWREDFLAFDKLRRIKAAHRKQTLVLLSVSFAATVIAVLLGEN